ncbi:MAG TPA: DUF4956 domain-containing protein [Kofleriaceae bacterium]|nr:DUF4956 domain-containing protein [Kofleriaceae bacterium]
MELLFGTQTFVDDDLFKLLGRLAIDLVFAAITIRVVYFRLYRHREYVFTYFLFNIITFCLCMLLRKVTVELGFAMGLFAVFGILRYRTEAIRLVDLTYLFIVIGLGILNAAANRKISVAELLAVNAAIVGATALLELSWSARSRRVTPMHYDRIELLRPGHELELHADIGERTGLAVTRVDIHRVDMVRDAAEILVHSIEPRSRR